MDKQGDETVLRFVRPGKNLLLFADRLQLYDWGRAHPAAGVKARPAKERRIIPMDKQTYMIDQLKA
jgi:hypothetical protein